MLYIFDVDGTIADRDSTDLYPHVRSWLEAQRGQGHQFAIATNQGGVGWRYWLESDPPQWAAERGITAEGLPEARQVRRRVGQITLTIREIVRVPCAAYLCYAYATNRGAYGPVPPGSAGAPEWDFGRRKPAPGMLHDAMSAWRVSPADTIMVGDRDEDRLAADAAGCGFAWAKDFFREETP